jgi:two-component system chemotaxis response regulator CheY
MTARRVLSVGQCGADHWSISRTLEKAFPVEVEAAATAREALEMMRHAKYALVLVNRIFDADGDSGLNLIRTVKSDEQLADVPIMLVSNFAECQQQAARAGALPGFGKAALGAAPMLECVGSLLKE